MGMRVPEQWQLVPQVHGGGNARPDGTVRRRRFVVWSTWTIVLANVAYGVAIASASVAAFCVGFILVWGAPPSVTAPAFATFTLWGEVATLPVIVAASVCLIGAWAAPDRPDVPKRLVYATTIIVALWLILALTSMIWLHPGVPIPW
jgi:hypothetical protein